MFMPALFSLAFLEVLFLSMTMPPLDTGLALTRASPLGPIGFNEFYSTILFAAKLLFRLDL
jgi:hypothetical protein